MRSIGALLVAMACGLLGYSIGLHQTREYLRSGVQWQFLEAAGRNNVPPLEALRASGADVNGVPCDAVSCGIPAIHIAAGSGNPAVVGWLIRNGADINVALGPDTALSSAEEHLKDAQSTVELLKTSGAKHWNEH